MMGDTSINNDGSGGGGGGGSTESWGVIPRAVAALFEAYIEDERVREFLEESTDAAYRDMLDRFAEAIERGLWTPRRNSMQAGLERLRASLEETQT